MDKFINRMKEPSTYAGLGGVALILGMNAGDFQMYVNAVAGVFMFISMVLGERGA